MFGVYTPSVAKVRFCEDAKEYYIFPYGFVQVL